MTGSRNGEGCASSENLRLEKSSAHESAFVPGLVRATGGGDFVKAPARLAALLAAAQPLLRRLCDDARLLVFNRERDREETVEIAHEALLRVWPLLQEWIRDDAKNLQQVEAVQRATFEWTARRKDADFLIHRRDRLLDAEALSALPRFGGQLDNAARTYLAACRKAQNESDERERQG